MFIVLFRKGTILFQPIKPPKIGFIRNRVYENKITHSQYPFEVENYVDTEGWGNIASMFPEYRGVEIWKCRARTPYKNIRLIERIYPPKITEEDKEEIERIGEDLIKRDIRIFEKKKELGWW